MPEGRILEVFGPECLAEDTFLQYSSWSPSGERMNHKGGTIRRLYERFHQLPQTGKGRRSNDAGAAYYVASVNDEGRIFSNRIEGVVDAGLKPCFLVTTAAGETICASADHKFYTGCGYTALSDLTEGSTVFVHNNTPYKTDDPAPRRNYQEIFVKHHPHAPDKVVRSRVSRSEELYRDYCYKRLRKSHAVLEAEMNGLTVQAYVKRLNQGNLDGLCFLDPDAHVHHQDECVENNARSNLAATDAVAHGKHHATERHNNLRFTAVEDVVVSIVAVGEKHTYDVCMAAPFNNFVADRFVVHNSAGKTSMALHLMAQAQAAGWPSGFVDAEHALDVTWARKLGVDTAHIILSQPDCGEQALEIVEQLVRAGVRFVVVDSVAALTPRAEIQGDMGDAHVGLQARLMSQALRKLTALVYTQKAIVLFINQLRMKIGVQFGNPETTTGGNALKFYASLRLDVRRIGAVKIGEETIGNRVRVKVVKNKVAPPFMECELDLLYGSGFDRAGDLLDVALLAGVVQQAGAWYSFGEQRLGQGRDQAAKTMRSSPETQGEIRQAVVAQAKAAAAEVV